jgi:glutathione S-transferase
MSDLRLHVLSLRYSSWSIRPWLALAAAGADFEVETVEIPDMLTQSAANGPALVDLKRDQLVRRRAQGSVTGLFPVLYVDGTPIHESLAICEFVADTFPDAGLWPEAPLDRARARAVCCEMSTGFPQLRTNLSCHVFARVADFRPDATTMIDIDRVFEIWRTSLDRSGGPFLFGAFGIPDCFYFPVLSRFRTYGIALEPQLEAYAARLESHAAVVSWREVAARAPAIAPYDEMIRGLGGDPAALL